MLSRMIYMWISLIVHLVMHELGHIVFGTMSGYTLVSSQVLMLKLSKRNGEHIHFQIAPPVIGGVTYMVPKSESHDRFIAYSLGGAAVNVLLAVPAAVLSFLYKEQLHLFFAVFSIIGFLFAIANTIPFWITEWKNDGSDVYLMLHNPCARASFLAALQIDRHVYLGNSLLSVNQCFLQPKEYGDAYSFGLAQMYAYLLLLKGKYSEQREFIAKVKASNDAFVKQRSVLLDAMIIENEIISGAPIELIKGHAEQQDFKLISKSDCGLACRLLYWLSVKGFAPAESAPEYYAEQHEKFINNCGSQADAELAANVMKLINKTVSQENT